MARLTVSVNDETVERLRTLAGGERKIGAMLDDVTAWLWAQRDALQSHGLSEYSLGTDAQLAEADRQYTEDMERTARLEAEVDAMRSMTENYQRSILAFLAEHTGLTVEDVTQRIDARRRRLAQEDGSDNDA